MINKPFGLDIGSTTMKAVWLSSEQKGSGYILKSVTHMNTPPKGMVSESPLDEEEMAQAIRGMVSNAKITTKDANIALPEGRVYTKVLEMPMLSDKELTSAIYWEAEQHIPIPLDTMTIDWKILEKPAKETAQSKIEVLLVAAPTTIIKKYQRILGMAGIQIVSIETEILSALRVLTYSIATSGVTTFPNSIILNIGSITTSFAIVREGIIVFTYSVPMGGLALNRVIAADFGFSLTQAEEYKKTYGISPNEFGGKIGKATEPILMSIVTEVKKAIAFYYEKYKEEQQLQQIVLIGGGSKLLGIDLYFAQNCNIETIIANPWKILGVQKLPDEIFDNASLYSVAVGLAMRDYE